VERCTPFKYTFSECVPYKSMHPIALDVHVPLIGIAQLVH